MTLKGSNRGFTVVLRNYGLIAIYRNDHDIWRRTYRPKTANYPLYPYSVLQKKPWVSKLLRLY